jgi:WD40 repeat protein
LEWCLEHPDRFIPPPEPPEQHDSGNGYWQATFHPDGKFAAVASIKDGTLLISAETGLALPEEEQPKPRFGFPVSAVAFSPDGTYLASAVNRFVLKEGSWRVLPFIAIWDIQKRILLTKLEGHDNTIRTLAFSPNSRHLASGGYDKQICIWDVENWTAKVLGNAHSGWVSSLMFNSLGSLLASAGGDLDVKIWDANTLDLVRPCKGHRSPVERIAFSPNCNRLASVGLDGELRLWSVHTGELLRKPLLGHVGPAFGVAFTPDGTRIASCGLDRTVKLWDARSGLPLLSLTPHREIVWSVEFSQDGNKLLSASFDGSARIWEGGVSQGLEPLPELPDEGESVKNLELANQVAFRPKSRNEYAVTGWDGSVTIRDAVSKEIRITLGSPDRAHRGPVWGICYSSEGDRIVTASWDGTVKLWEADSGRFINEISVDRGLDVGAHAIALDPAGRKLAIGTLDGKAGVWDIQTGKRDLTLNRHFSYLTWAVAYSPNGRWIVTGGFTPGLFIWDAVTGDLVASRAQPPEMAFLGVGSSLAARLAFLRLTAPQEAYKSSVFKLAFSPDGKWLASASWDSSVWLWKVPIEGETWPEAPKWRSKHDDYVTAVAFSPDCKTLATGGMDDEIRFWDVSSGRQRGHKHLSGMAWDVAWDPTGKKVLAANWWRPTGIEFVDAPP